MSDSKLAIARPIALAFALVMSSSAAAEPAPGEPAAPAAAVPIDKSPSFEIRDRGDAVEVIAHNIKAARTAIIPIRSRLQIPLVGAPTAKRIQPGDKTVKLIELDSDSAIRVLSVKLGFEREDVKALSRFAQAIQVGDDLHVIVPRKLPADGLSPKLPGPSLPPDLAAAVAKIDQAPEQRFGPRTDPSTAHHAEAKIDAKIETPAAKPTAHIDATAGAKIDATSGARIDTGAAPQAAAPHAAAATNPIAATAPIANAEPVMPARPARPAGPSGDPKSLKQTLASDTSDSWSKVSMYGAIGLAAAGAGIWLMRRRKAQLAPGASIDVIAQRSLGGKARILWLSVGPREMLVSVTGQQVRMLGQWRKTEAPSALPAAHTYSGALPDAAAQATQAAHAFNDLRFDPPHDSREPRSARDPRDKPVSPAVSPAVTGILRLRARTGQMPISEAVATGDVEADELWAKEILAATGGRA